MASGTIIPGFLTGSSNGRGIQVAATASPGTLLHTSVTGTQYFDVHTIFAVNHGDAAITLTVQFGGTSDPRDLIEIDIPSKCGQVLVVDRLRLNNGLAVRAYASVANVVTIFGHVETIEL